MLFKEFTFIFEWETERHDVKVTASDEAQAIDMAEMLAYKAGEALNIGVEFGLQRYAVTA